MDCLPEKFRQGHELCFFLHDFLVETMKSGEKGDIFSHSFEFSSELDLSQLDGESLFLWLDENGYKEEAYLIYFKQICAALIADMLNFIYEALECSRKGKLTVTYSLLRKPLKENLFYLEWLLADVEELIHRFHLGDIRLLTLNKNMPEHKKIEIITKATKRLDLNILDADSLYRLRFDKKVTQSFEPLFQKATHLITTFDFMETESQNFNFIFSNNDSLDSQWEHLYNYLPLLLFHTVQIVEALISNFAKRASGIDLSQQRCLIGLSFWIQKTSTEIDMSQVIVEIKNMFNSEDIKCDKCNSKIKFTNEKLFDIYSEYKITCDTCHWTFDLIKFHSHEYPT